MTQPTRYKETTEMKRNHTPIVLLAYLALAAIMLPGIGGTALGAELLDYSETWQTADTGTGTNGQPVGGYTEWTYYEFISNISNARVTDPGEFWLAKANGSANALAAYVTPSSVGLSPGATFAPSNQPFDVRLEISVEAGIGANSNTTPGSQLTGLLIGDIAASFLPGYSGPGTNFRIQQLDDTDLYNNDGNLSVVNIGFAPGNDNTTTNTGFTRLEITITEKDADEYTFDYTITDLADSSSTYSNTIDILKTVVGPLDRIGVRYMTAASEGANAEFRNFELVLIPEPASMALLGLGGLLLIKRRRG